MTAAGEIAEATGESQVSNYSGQKKRGRPVSNRFKRKGGSEKSKSESRDASSV